MIIDTMKILYLDDPSIRTFCNVCGDEMFCCDVSMQKIEKEYGIIARVKCRDTKVNRLSSSKYIDAITKLKVATKKLEEARFLMNEVDNIWKELRE